MKRYDSYYMVESKQTGAKTFDLYPDEWKSYLEVDAFNVYVKCRRCNASHLIGKRCWCCDLETKVR